MGLRQNNTAAPLPEYELQRKNLRSTLARQRVEKKDALERRFAQLQGGPSGAQIKIGNQLEDEIHQNELAAEGELNSQEALARRMMQEQERQRQYQTSERLGGQQFAGEQGALQRQYGTSERLGSQQFQSGEAGKILDFQKQQEAFNQQARQRQLEQIDREYSADQRTTEFNKLTALMQSSDWRVQQQGLRGIIADPQASPAAREAAQLMLAGQQWR